VFKINEEQWRILLSRLGALELEIQSVQRGLGLKEAQVRTQETGFLGPTTTLMQSLSDMQDGASAQIIDKIGILQSDLDKLAIQSQQLAAESAVRSDAAFADKLPDILALLQNQAAVQQERFDEMGLSLQNAQKNIKQQQSTQAKQLLGLVRGQLEALPRSNPDSNPALEQMLGLPDQLKSQIEGSQQHTSNEANALLNAILGQLQAGSNAISAQVAGLPDQFRGQVEGSQQHTSNEANALLNAILGQLQAGSNAAANQIGALPEQINGLVEGVKQHQSNEANGLLNAILGQLQGGSNAVAAQVVSAATHIGSQIQGAQQHTSNEANSLLNAILGQVQGSTNSLSATFGASMHSITQWLTLINQQQQGDLVRANLQWRGIIALQKASLETTKAAPILPFEVDFDSQLAKLRELAPNNFKTWSTAFTNAIKHYTEWASDSLSTQTHPHGHLYEQFILAHAHGRVLDLGVGVLPVPAYLESYDIELVHGLDPLPPLNSHPFPFSRSVSEFIPWPDSCMDSIVMGGSLDHIYLPDRAFKECARVLKPRGKLIIITGLEASNSDYNPYGPTRPACDEFHLFHPSLEDILGWTKGIFDLIECLEPLPNNGFLAFQRR
jgi:SAM-dependent methyltransferase